MKLYKKLMATALLAIAPAAFADTINPESYSATLEVGESVTITKTVTIEETVSTGTIDVVFLIDTSGSMGAEIAAAKAAATDILNGLAAYGDLGVATGYYSEPGSNGAYSALTTNTATALADINAINLGMGGGGGDFPEEGIHATYEAASDTAWREGSNRFIIALGDANFKESDGSTLAMAQSALADSGATFIGIDFGAMTSTWGGGIDPQVLADASGGSITDASAGADSITTAILSSVDSAFATYTSVSVDDFGAGMPGIDVSVTCLTAAAGGSCSGSEATGSWTRETENTFTFDVTFTALAEGTYAFPTHALVDGGIVASEADRFVVGAGGGSTPVPAPGTLLLMGLGLVTLRLRALRR